MIDRLILIYLFVYSSAILWVCTVRSGFFSLFVFFVNSSFLPCCLSSFLLSFSFLFFFSVQSVIMMLGPKLNTELSSEKTKQRWPPVCALGLRFSRAFLLMLWHHGTLLTQKRLSLPKLANSFRKQTTSSRVYLSYANQPMQSPYSTLTSFV